MMEISAALAGAQIAANVLDRIFSKDAGSQQAALEASPPAGTPSATALRRIAAGYDLANISPGEVSEMLQELHQAGVLDDQQYLDLAQIRADLDAAGVQATDRIDLIAFYAEKAGKLAAATASPETAAEADSLQRRYGWLAKFSMLQAASGSGAFNAVA